MRSSFSKVAKNRAYFALTICMEQKHEYDFHKCISNEMDTSEEQKGLVSKLVSAGKKNAKVARAGGVSLMALSLAACGSSDGDTTDSLQILQRVLVTHQQSLQFQ